MRQLYSYILIGLLALTATISAKAQSVEVEPNDYFRTAMEITDMNFMMDASFSSAQDVDIFKLQLEEGYMYHITSSHSDVDVRAELYWWSGAAQDTTVSEDRTISGNIIIRAVNGRASSGDFRLANWVTPPEFGTGTYYLRLTNGSVTGGEYKLRVFRTKIADFMHVGEPNNNFTEALITFSDPVNGFQAPTDGTPFRAMNYNPSFSYVYPQSGNAATPGIHGMVTSIGGEDMDYYLFEGVQGQRVEMRSYSPLGAQFTNLGLPHTGHNRDSDGAARILDADERELAGNDDKDAEDGEDYNASDLYPYVVVDSLPYTGLYILKYMPLYSSGWSGHAANNTDSDPDRGEYVVSLMVAERDAEAEPNNTPQEATRITARNIHKNSRAEKETYKAQFSSESDVDWYQVALFDEYMYYINTFDSSVDKDIQVEIYSTDDLSVNLIDNTPAGKYGDGNFRVSGFVPPYNGTYLIKVSLPSGGLANGKTGDYNLRVAMSLISKSGNYDRNNEPNNTIADAAQLTPIKNDSTVVTSMLWPKGDIDLFPYNGAEGEVVSFETMPIDPNFPADVDTYLRILSANGTVVFTNDATEGRPSDWVYAGVRNFEFPSAGLYFFEVTSKFHEQNGGGANHGNNDVGLYRIYLMSSAANPIETETEPNDDFAQATPLADGQVLQASIATANDVDIFKVHLKKDHMYMIRSMENNFSGATSVSFFKATDTATNLHDGTDWHSRYGSNNFRLPALWVEEDADYYVRVEGTPGSAGGNYKITMESTYIGDLVNKNEPNDTIEEAHAQGPYPTDGIPRAFVLFNPNDPKGNNDVDMYRVDLKAGQAMTAQTHPTRGEGWSRDTDTAMALYKADGTKIADDDDSGLDWYSRISYIAEADETVYVQVLTSRHPLRGSEPTDRDPSRGDYILTISSEMMESEPNDTAENANMVPVSDNNLMSATFSGTDLVDWFKADLLTNRMYYINTAESDVTANIEIEVYAENDLATNLIDQTPFGRYNSNDFLLGFNPPADGTYLFKLSVPPTALGGQTRGYKLRVAGGDFTLAEMAEMHEPNNNTAEADLRGNVLAAADSVYYTTASHADDDIDFFMFEGRAGEVATVETFPTNGPRWVRDFDTIVRILDQNGAELVSNDDKEDPLSRELYDVGTVYSKASIELPYTGKYYAVVLPFNGAANERTSTFGRPATGAYDVAVSVKSKGTPVNIDEENTQPIEFALHQNYPNPFNPTTNIRFDLPAAANVKLVVYNILGQPVMTLVDGFRHAGSHMVSFNASRLASGMYLYRLEAGKFTKVQKMTLIK